MRRASSVEALYADAFTLAERGKALERDPERAARAEAARCFEDAIRILSRLAIVESAAKRELAQGAVRELRERIARLERQQQEEEAAAHEEAAPVDADALLARAMAIHADARERETRGVTDECIELYLSAGDWYMKAYAALDPEAKSTKDAVREQIEYVIDHVSELKAAAATREALPQPEPAAASVDAMDWPLPPADSPALAVSVSQSTAPPPQPLLPSRPLSEAPIDTSWPLPPLPAPVLQSSVSESSSAVSGHDADTAWPLPPGIDAPAASSSLLPVNGLDPSNWPLAPQQASSAQRRNSRRSNPPSRTSSNDSLPVTRVADSRDESVAYSPAELDVLRRSSLINGHIFVPWLDDVDSQENFRLVNLFVDPDGTLPLSAKQDRKGACWMRPSDYAQLCAQAPVMIDDICPQVVKQDIVTDCSFVASLCIAAAYEQRFQKRLITNIIFPVDPRTKQPMYNPSGKYIVKLWANGVPRKVVIDDFLPVSQQSQDMLCSCTTRKNELWVSLIEKAYLKLCGGYDYPGGNSGIDLFALTGWIPERIALADLARDATREDRIWEQLKSAFHYGDCIITMTTGAIGKDQAKSIGLVPMHVYAVLNVYETTLADGATGAAGKKRRLIHVKNPWRKLGWKGPYSRLDVATWCGPIGDELRAYQSKFYAVSERSSDASDDDDGMFWIDLDSVKQHFESLYLNWNPELFPHKYTTHEHWPVSLGPANDSITLGYNPQYSLQFSHDTSEPSAVAKRTGTRASSSTVWVLLTRHVSTVERDTEPSAQQFLTLHVYRNTKGKRVFYNQDAMYRGTYSNNPHTLVSLDVDITDDDPEPSFTLVASQYEKFAPLDYTLSVFSTAPFACHAVPHLDAAPNALIVQGEWTALTAGGRPFFSSFMNNPQFHIELRAPASRVLLFLETESASDDPAQPDETPINLRAVLHTRERVCGLSGSASQCVLSSGEYRPGFCFLEIDAAEAATLCDLVLVPSTFERDSLARFRVRIVSDPPTTTTAIARALPMEGDGMELHTLSGRWDMQLGTAVGCASYGCYTFNPKFLVHVTNECSLFVRLIASRERVDSSSAAPSFNVSVFSCTPDGGLLLSTNPKVAYRGATSEDGAYSGANPCGVATPQRISFGIGWYAIIPSTYEPHEANFELRVYSSRPVAVRLLS